MSIFQDRQGQVAPLSLIAAQSLARCKAPPALPKCRRGVFSPCTNFVTDTRNHRGYRAHRLRKTSKPAALDSLSPRERQVLKLVVEGKTSKEIAAIVGVKPSSIDTYRSRIMAKLEVGDLPSLVRFAIRHGVIKA